MAYFKRVSLIVGLAAALSVGSSLPAQASLGNSDEPLTQFDPHSALVPEKLAGEAEATKLAAELDGLAQPTAIAPAENQLLELADLPTEASETPVPEAEPAVVPGTEPLESEAEPLDMDAEAPEAVPSDAGVSTSADELMSPEAGAVEGEDGIEAAPGADTADTETGADQELEIAQTTRAAYRGITPAYLGVGGNLGFGDNDSGVSDFGFAVLSKVSLGPRFSLRPSVIIAEDRTSFTVPLTYNFNVYELQGFRFQPFAGVGADIATDGDTGLLLNTGIDIPISRDFTLNATGNFRVTDGFGFGLILGVGYNFPLIFD